MQQITRRNALTASLASGAALIAGFAGGQEPRTATEKPAKDRESAVTFNLKNVVIEEEDEANATITARCGNKEKPCKLVNLPVAKQAKVVGSNVFPSSANTRPFRWQHLKDVKGKQVSIKLRVEGDELSVVSVSWGND